MAVSLARTDKPRARRIIEAVIVPSNCRAGRFMATIMALFDDGELEDVLSYYDDELCFSAREFMGLTRPEVYDLFMRRDGTYLRS